jgi:ribosomal-protein-serine acetyltransferase
MFRLQFRPDAALVLLEERHAAEIYGIIQRDREYLAEWLPWVDMTRSVGDIAVFIRKSLEQFARNEGFHAGIVQNGHICGFVGLKPVDWMNRKTEIGYWLASECQGKGLMTEACRAVVDLVFGEWNLHRAEIRVAVGNERSAGVPQRLGFTLEGTLRHAQKLGDKWLDLRIFGLLNDEWKRRCELLDSDANPV